MATPKPGYSVSVANLRDDFSAYMKLIESGKTIEVVDRRTPIGIISLSHGTEKPDIIEAERDATRKFRELFTLVNEGKRVVITRLSGPSVLLSQCENAEPR